MTDLSETSRKLWDLWNAKKPLPGVGGQMVGLERYRLDANGMQFEALCEASDEIERLRAQLAAVERERDELRAHAREHLPSLDRIRDSHTRMTAADMAAGDNPMLKHRVYTQDGSDTCYLCALLLRAEQAETALAGARQVALEEALNQVFEYLKHCDDQFREEQTDLGRAGCAWRRTAAQAIYASIRALSAMTQEAER